MTSKAFCAFRKEELDPDLEDMGQNSEVVGADDASEELQMSPAITIMKPILRFLQLLCENHNSGLQVLAFLSVSEGPTAVKALLIYFSSNPELSSQPKQ